MKLSLSILAVHSQIKNFDFTSPSGRKHRCELLRDWLGGFPLFTFLWSTVCCHHSFWTQTKRIISCSWAQFVGILWVLLFLFRSVNEDELHFWNLSYPILTTSRSSPKIGLAWQFLYTLTFKSSSILSWMYIKVSFDILRYMWNLSSSSFNWGNKWWYSPRVSLSSLTGWALNRLFGSELLTNHYLHATDNDKSSSLSLEIILYSHYHSLKTNEDWHKTSERRGKTSLVN